MKLWIVVGALFGCAVTVGCASESPSPSTATTVPDAAFSERAENPSAIDKGEGPADAAAEAPLTIADAEPDPTLPPKCGEAPAETFTPPSSPRSDTYPEIKHWEIPAANVVALTFDDGPSPKVTNKILDTLRAEKIRATFFINSRATSDLRVDEEAQKTVQRIVAEGHVLGNHTASHYDLRDASVDVEAQLRFVEEDIRAAAPCAPPITLVRTPFGQPQLAGTAEDRARVLPIVARHGVHVGWTIESLDYECGVDGPSCVVNRVKRRLDLGKRGSILMHDTQPVTAEALPAVIAEIRKRGIEFVTAERLVRDKYGKSSPELVAEVRAKE